jgi:hypothetical protein
MIGTTMKKIILPFCTLFSAFSLYAQAGESPFDLRVDAKFNYRLSNENRYPTPFPPGSAHETVEAGDHLEVSDIAVFGKWQMTENWQAVAKIDFIDLYERNPTSSDHEIDLDNFFVRYGTKHSNDPLPESIDFYGQFGKFGKFERQEDRHLESYGLISTAFNRLEDSGFEFGLDFPTGIYGKLSYTTGNPFYFRDPNALAGDNGVLKHPDKDIKSGLPIFYDAEVENMDLSNEPETGGALGYRWLNDGGNSRVNVMIFNYRRDMADEADLHGTVYGGDMDLFAVTPIEVPALTSTIRLSSNGKKKDENGINVWWYYNDLAVFVQYVTQNAAGLKRSGEEIELSYAFDNIPGIVGITPVLRYSKLTPDFNPGPAYPSPSVSWEWTKYDMGFNVDFTESIRLTIEYAQNDIIRKKDRENNDEALMTLRWRYDL